MQIRQATADDIDLLVPLFDAYRRFYRQPADPDRARRFLLDRLTHNQSVVFLALEAASALGFTQLYPSFSSVGMAPIFVLNDLFVEPQARQLGAGSALLQAAVDHGRRSGALRLVLSTEVTNATAQSLYESQGWLRDMSFYTYQFTL